MSIKTGAASKRISVENRRQIFLKTNAKGLVCKEAVELR